jgi:hypothetical protein
MLSTVLSLFMDSYLGTLPHDHLKSRNNVYYFFYLPNCFYTKYLTPLIFLDSLEITF